MKNKLDINKLILPIFFALIFQTWAGTNEVQLADEVFMAPGLPPIMVDNTARNEGPAAASTQRVGQKTATTMYVNILDFGAIGDGKTSDTKAIQRAIDVCTKQGGGTVYCPAGYTFLIGTLELKNNTTLHIEAGATLLGSDQLNEYNRDIGKCPYWPEPLEGCMIYANKAYNIALTGMGTIDGGCRAEQLYVQEGAALFTEDGQLTGIRPMAIRFRDCERIRIENLRFIDSRSWFTHLQFCKDVVVTGLTIDNKYQDGFNIESCENVHISNCNLNCGDDAFAFTTSDKNRPVRNVTVVNCIAKSIWAGVRMGPLSKGNFENILFSNVIFYDCQGGGIKLDPVEGGEVKNCQFDNIRMDNVVSPISILTAQWEEIGSQDETPKLMPPSKIKDIIFSNMIIDAKGTCMPQPDHNSTIFIHGHKDAIIENILLSNITMTFPGEGTQEHARRRDMLDAHEIDWDKYGYWHSHKHIWGVPPAYALYARHVDGLKLHNIDFRLATPDVRPALVLKQCSDLDIQQLEADLSAEADALIVAINSDSFLMSQLRINAPVPLLKLEESDSKTMFIESPSPFSQHSALTKGE